MAVAAILSGLGQALAQPAQAQIPDFRAGQVLRAGELNAIVQQLNRNTAALSLEGGATHAVNCSTGTIAAAIAAAQPGDTIAITGTCNEAVVVNKDGITLDGGGTAIIDGSGSASINGGNAADGAVIGVNGQRNVVIRGLTVRNGRRGIAADRGAAVWLEDVTARSNGTGIVIAGNSFATFAGEIRGNDNDVEGGIELRQSTAWADDATLIQANGNNEGGIAIHRGSQMFLVNVGTVEVNANGGFNGILCYLGSSLSVVAVDGNAINFRVTDNAGEGIWVGSGAQMTLEGVNLTVTGNGSNGLAVFSASVVQLFGGYSYADSFVPAGSAVFSDNAFSGIYVNGNSLASLSSGGVTIRSNGGDGVVASNGADVTLSDATVADNQPYDISVSLHSRVGWYGSSSVGNVRCRESSFIVSKGEHCQ